MRLHPFPVDFRALLALLNDRHTPNGTELIRQKIHLMLGQSAFTEKFGGYGPPSTLSLAHETIPISFSVVPGGRDTVLKEPLCDWTDLAYEVRPGMVIVGQSWLVGRPGDRSNQPSLAGSRGRVVGIICDHSSASPTIEV